MTQNPSILAIWPNIHLEALQLSSHHAAINIESGFARFRQLLLSIQPGQMLVSVGPTSAKLEPDCQDRRKMLDFVPILIQMVNASPSAYGCRAPVFIFKTRFEQVYADPVNPSGRLEAVLLNMCVRLGHKTHATRSRDLWGDSRRGPRTSWGGEIVVVFAVGVPEGCAVAPLGERRGLAGGACAQMYRFKE